MNPVKNTKQQKCKRKMSNGMKIAVVAINKKGEALAKKIKDGFLNARVFSAKMRKNGALNDLVKGIFNEYDGIIFISAVGIAVRVISSLLKTKHSDPAIVSVDSAGRFVVSVLSGHEGGANRLAYEIASIIASLPVVTTGNEVNKKFVLGIGTRKGISPEIVKAAIRKALIKKRLRLQDIRVVASV